MLYDVGHLSVFIKKIITNTSSLSALFCKSTKCGGFSWRQAIYFDSILTSLLKNFFFI